MHANPHRSIVLCTWPAHGSAPTSTPCLIRWGLPALPGWLPDWPVWLNIPTQAA